MRLSTQHDSLFETEQSLTLVVNSIQEAMLERGPISAKTTTKQDDVTKKVMTHIHMDGSKNVEKELHVCYVRRMELTQQN